MEAASTVGPVQPRHQAPQHMQALAYANRVRLARAELKRAVNAGNVNAGAVIRTCPWEAETMTVSELLRSQRRWGRTRARKFLLSLSLNESRQLGRLTERQRQMLANELDRKLISPPEREFALTG